MAQSAADGDVGGPTLLSWVQGSDPHQLSRPVRLFASESRRAAGPSIGSPVAIGVPDRSGTIIRFPLRAGRWKTLGLATWGALAGAAQAVRTRVRPHQTAKYGSPLPGERRVRTRAGSRSPINRLWILCFHDGGVCDPARHAALLRRLAWRMRAVTQKPPHGRRRWGSPPSRVDGADLRARLGHRRDCRRGAIRRSTCQPQPSAELYHR